VAEVVGDEVVVEVGRKGTRGLETKWGLINGELELIIC
jgi:hypothetical protein